MLTHVKFLCGQTDGRTDQIPPNLRLPGGGGGIKHLLLLNSGEK